MNTNEEYHCEYDIQTMAARLNFLVGSKVMFRNFDNQICVVTIDAIVAEEKDGKPIVEFWSRLGKQRIESKQMLGCIVTCVNGEVKPLTDVFEEAGIVF